MGAEQHEVGRMGTIDRDIHEFQSRAIKAAVAARSRQPAAMYHSDLQAAL